jgi:NAD(P)-dependent dehydrogenase (short-subunit alcohol dehydrogenase family)
MNSVQTLFDLHNKIAVVTGGSSGIGRAMAWALGMQGAKLVLVARSRANLDAAVNAFAQDGIDAQYVVADLTDAGQLQHVVHECNAAFADSDASRTPDILINSAGNNIRKSFPELTDADIRATLALNLEAPLALIRAFAPAMQAKGWGRIINIASQQSFRAFNHSGAYGISKGGIVSLTRSVAEHYSKFGVTCNSIAPAFVRTPLTEAAMSNPEFVATQAAKTMIGRNGEPADYHGAAVFLASDASAFVTGHTLYVDGGYGAK